MTNCSRPSVQGKVFLLWCRERTASGNLGHSFALVTTEEKLAVEQLDDYHSEDKLKSRNHIRKVRCM